MSPSELLNTAEQLFGTKANDAEKSQSSMTGTVNPANSG
jgi:hypothetical protein